MKKIISLLLISLSLISCKENSAEQVQEPDTYPVIEVSVRTVTDFSSFPANIEGTINSAVRAKVSGYVTNVLVDEGQEVKKGQLLFRLETESLTQDAEAAQAAVNAAQVEVNKLVPLVEKNIISEVQLETAKAQLAQARSGYNSIAANIGYANIQSPVDGYVGAINFRSGNLVSPTDAMPLTTVSQTEEVYAFFSMNEAEFYDFMEKAEGKTRQEKLDNFPPVKLILAGHREYGHVGVIKTINAQVDARTGTVNFRATFPNPEGLLATGNSGRILIPRTYEDVLVIPSKATYEAQGRIYTFKLSQGDTVRNILIQGNKRIGDLMVVESGLQAGERIVAEGVAKLRDGQKIIPNPTAIDSIIGQTQPVFK